LPIRLHAPFTALCVEDAAQHALGRGGSATGWRTRCGWRRRSAARRSPFPAAGRSIADDVISFAQANNVTQIIIGKSTRSRWFEILHGSVVHDLVRRSGNISVHVIAGDDLARDPIPKKTLRPAEGGAPFDPWPYVVSLAAVAAALGVGELIQPLLGVENVDLVFLTAVVAVAVRYGLWPSLLATVASSLCYNFFFLPPTYTFTIADPTNLAALVFFTVVAVVVSHFAARGRTQTVAAHDRVRTVQLLYAFSRKLAGVGTLDDVLWATAYQAALMLKVRGRAAAAGGRVHRRQGRLSPRGHPRRGGCRGGEMGVAEQPGCRSRLGHAPGCETPVPAHANGPRRYRRHGDRQRQDRPASHSRSAPPARRVDRSGRARHRARLSGRGCGPGETHDRDRIGCGPALLTSISHDLKTPLAACWERPVRCATCRAG
jgi:two-component system sensor histidine kinase KdpD